MSARTIIQIGDPRLKQKNLPIRSVTSPQFKTLIQDLKDTMKKEGLIGIAAPQIAENYTVFVTHPRKTKSRNIGKGDTCRVYVNPKITYFSQNQIIIYEGCGCVPDIFGPVLRPIEIVIKALDETGKKFSLRCDGILSRVIQHEYDHLFGTEFIEKIYDYKKALTKEHYFKYIRNSEEQKKASIITKIDYLRVN